ncbi:MAG: chorismate synthase [Candidatus Sulfobium sp.]
MTKLRFLTSGESHGQALVGILEGIPAGVPVSPEDIDRQLRRRQQGYGRGGRMKIESDSARIMAGVRWGMTIGSPVSILVENRDWQNWREGMSPDAGSLDSIKAVTRPRPGHADLAGVLKYGREDIRDVLERSSARETAMRVALGAVARKFLSLFDIRVGSYVTGIGKAKAAASPSPEEKVLSGMFEKAEKSPVRCPDPEVSKKMIRAIDKAKKEGDSLGGTFDIFVTKLDGRLAQAVMSIQAIKGVEIGAGFEAGGRPGSEVMDEIFFGRKRNEKNRAGGFYRKTNNAGGIEGGMTNGMPVIVRAAMKPIPTLRRALRSVDIRTGRPFEAAYERSDVCAVPAAAIVAEAMAALVAADAFLEKFGGDSAEETVRNFDSYLTSMKRL